MIWGEIINSVRKIHLDLVQEFSIDPMLYTRDIEIVPAAIPFPESVDDYDEWDEIPVPGDLQDLLPLHPVERALIEGPLLPIQIIRFSGTDEIAQLFSVILMLEKSWLEKSHTSSPDKNRFLETACSIQTLKLSVRAGFQKLAPMKEK